MNLRWYQTAAITEIQKKLREGKRYILLVLHMGLGKTVVAAKMILMAQENGRRVLFIAHREFLILQCRDKLLRFGVNSGIIKALYKEDRSQKVQIASIQTLPNRKLPIADIVIVDEAHHATAPEYEKILNKYKASGAYIIGLTATPFPSSSKKGLKDIFDDYVNTITVKEAIEQEFLLDSKVFIADKAIDYSKITKHEGDYNSAEVFKAFDTENVYINLIDKYNEHIGKKKAIIFCVNKEHCKKVWIALSENGYKGSYVIDETSSDERIDCLKKLESGEYDFMCNVFVYTEGFDMPSLEASVLCYRTVSKAKYFQSAARAGRPLEEDEGVPREKKKKPFYTILDMADNTRRLNPIEFPFKISLEPRSKQYRIAPMRSCPKCGFYLQVHHKVCTECSTPLPVVEKTKKQIKEEAFIELDKQKLQVAPYLNFPPKRYNEIPSELLPAFAKEKGYKKAWVTHILRARGESITKKMVLRNYENFPDYHKQVNILSKAYFSKSYPIDAHKWQFIEETEKEVIYEYKEVLQ